MASPELSGHQGPAANSAHVHTASTTTTTITTTTTTSGGHGSAHRAAELLPLLLANGHAPGAALTGQVLQRLHAQILLEDVSGGDAAALPHRSQGWVRPGGSGMRLATTTAIHRSSELPTERLVRVLEGAAGPSPGPGGIAQVS